MNKKLQNEIREFIGDDPAKAVERVRAKRVTSWDFVDTLFGVGFWLDNVDTCFNERYGLTTYGAGLAAVMVLETEPHFPKAYFERMFALTATADEETRTAAMLWAAAWIIEPELEDEA